MGDLLFEACQEGSATMNRQVLGLFLLSFVMGCQQKAGDPGTILKLTSTAYVFADEKVYHDQAEVARAGGNIYSRGGKTPLLEPKSLLRVLRRDSDGARVLIEDAYVYDFDEKSHYVLFRKSSLRGEIGWVLASELKDAKLVPPSEVPIPSSAYVPPAP